MNNYKKTAVICAFVLASSFTSACSDNDDQAKTSDSKSESTSEKNVSEIDNDPTDSRLDIYLSEDGTPYYIDADGNKMILYAYADETEEDEYDPSDSYVYDNYDADGLKFEIPEGWFADTGYGAPMLLQESEDEINYDETIAILPAENVFESGDVSEDSINEYFGELVELGYYTEYKITDSGDSTVGKESAKYYDVLSTYSLLSDDDSEESETMSFRTRYIVTEDDNPYCVIITSNDSDDSFDYVFGIYESFADTIEISAAENTDGDAEE